MSLWVMLVSMDVCCTDVSAGRAFTFPSLDRWGWQSPAAERESESEGESSERPLGVGGWERERGVVREELPGSVPHAHTHTKAMLARNFTINIIRTNNNHHQPKEQCSNFGHYSNNINNNRNQTE